MLLKSTTARKLIAEGNAAISCYVFDDGVDHSLTQPTHVSIINYLHQRIDHFKADVQAISDWINA